VRQKITGQDGMIADKTILKIALFAYLFFGHTLLTQRPNLPETELILFAPLISKQDSSPTISGCPIFPVNNVWNTPIETLPLDANSASFIATIGAGTHLHADFGSGIWPDPGGFPIGIPFNVVTGNQPGVNITFLYDTESDPGPYPIPTNVLIEGDPTSGDRHILILNEENCTLFEIWNAQKLDQSGLNWGAGSGAIFDLRSNLLRPDTWTSADAAGLPILPLLIRYDEIAAGEIRHAIRFTASQTRRAYIWPARHYASSFTDPKYPPMGQRFRLQANYDISTFSQEAQIILKAMKKYGLVLADNGNNWYFGGVPDERWNNNVLHEFDRLTGTNFEAVDESSLMIDPDSGQAKFP